LKKGIIEFSYGIIYSVKLSHSPIKNKVNAPVTKNVVYTFSLAYNTNRKYLLPVIYTTRKMVSDAKAAPE
jgi:hypothetical protein